MSYRSELAQQAARTKERARVGATIVQWSALRPTGGTPLTITEIRTDPKLKPIVADRGGNTWFFHYDQVEVLD